MDAADVRLCSSDSIILSTMSARLNVVTVMKDVGSLMNLRVITSSDVCVVSSSPPVRPPCVFLSLVSDDPCDSSGFYFVKTD